MAEARPPVRSDDPFNPEGLDAMTRIRKALKLIPQATLDDIAFHVECVVADLEEKHDQIVQSFLLTLDPERRCPTCLGSGRKRDTTCEHVLDDEAPIPTCAKCGQVLWEHP